MAEDPRRMNHERFEERWAEIDTGVAAMVVHLETRGKGSAEGFNPTKNQMTMYTLVYHLCTDTSRLHELDAAPDVVKEELVDKFEIALNDYHASVVPLCAGLVGDALLRVFLERWANHRSVRKWMELTFDYVGRDNYGRQGQFNDRARPLEGIATNSFRYSLYEQSKSRVRDALLVLIEKERRGEVIDSGLVGPCLGIFVNLGPRDAPLSVYREDFETFFLKATNQFYLGEGRSWIDEDSCTAYLIKAERRLEEEEGRIGNYLNPETRTELMRVVERALLGEHEERLIGMENSGMVAMLRRGADGFEDLKRMYRLFHRLDSSLGTSQRAATAAAANPLMGHAAVGDAVGASAVGLGPLVALFREHVRREGFATHEREELSSDSKSLGTYVAQLLALHDRFGEYVTECFGSHPAFSKALKDAFESFMNKPLHGPASLPARAAAAAAAAAEAAGGSGGGGAAGNGGGVGGNGDDGAGPSSSSSASSSTKPLHGTTTTAELLANYADKLMRGGKEREAEGILGEEQLDRAMDRLVKLFGYVADKDMFQEFYRKMLGKRLLMGRSESEDLERALIGKLKFQYGASFTSKLEGMINDKNMNRELQAGFEAHLRERAASGGGGGQLPAGLGVEVQVLQMGHWPQYPIDGLKLPTALARAVEVYKVFYQSRTSSRRLQWVHSLSSVTMVARLGPPAKPVAYTVTMSLHVACVLLLFNEHAALSAGAIEEALGLTQDEVRLAVASVAFGKQQLLVKASEKDRKKKSVGRDDVFEVNPAFKYVKTRFAVANAQAKMSAEEVATTATAVEADRRYMIDAAVVRVMKSMRVVSHQDLMTEAVAQLKKYFNPKVSAIKQRIEDLISRDYMKRSESGNATYEYIA
jgi:cullin 1